ncbi:helix-turn-helix transcriptional regulator [Mycolicibacter arupensis]|uniref:Protein pafC n=1 Tax=Mycolicibacter arupensis TaxID=342002 RepID=A0A0F5N3A9_9MYCO|nr:YafY family protein [Mycolicibacter arupensis]KKC00738.1 protein pafC [Mycolicibacter arupensis]MCV7275283.1 YafY family transcriptional regulator [Mycolicibacter arupensis]ORA00405.1 protein pafC [Mycolicibacter arupensis]
MTQLSKRLVRLLNMVPYLKARPGITKAQAAAELGVSLSQLQTDLEQLVMCGLPGYGPGELIDVTFYDDRLDVFESAGVDRPLRLTSREATAMLMALRTLVDMPGIVDPRAARSAIAKVEEAAGAAAPAPPASAASDESAADVVRDGVRRRRALGIDYYAASRDSVSHRVVDPIRVVLIGSHSYLEAWCRESEGVRLFRFDRIDEARLLDEPAAPPEPARHAETDTSLFDADPSLPVATVRLAPSAAWMFEYYPMQAIGQLPDGWMEAQLTYASEEWLTRLLLGLGDEVQVVAPESLAVAVRDTALGALAMYEQVRR